ncbi:SNF1- protein kinase regulatory subunit beta-1 [Turnera subulata]|uniref:SNF1- protein kinase regulatory subunit beta-1 n=1 Tax=Turnera subulata TaxID=218843 RepID=A0A9Q0G1K5_9ROSI|nr:SNF1- protein kinase regulatory subunit beta-1 [Turnera subulata]
MGNAAGREEGGGGVGGDTISSRDGRPPKSSSSPSPSPSPSPSSSSSSHPNHPAAPSTSPFLFPSPQVPLAPVQRGNGPSPSLQTPAGGVAAVDEHCEPGIPIIISWNYGGNEVHLEGSWDNWTSRKKLQRSGKDHSILLVLPSGIYHYKFIVDGEWRYIPDLPFEADDLGRVCNLLDVNDYVPEDTDGVAEFEAPPSPDSSYSQEFPVEEDFAKEPVVVPPQLHLTVLGVGENSKEASSSKPHHVVLNHLFIEKGWASQSLVALGMTHRFQSKYVTVCLYKPLKR